MDKNLKYLLALHRAPLVGSQTLNALTTQFEELETLFKTSSTALKALKLSDETITGIKNPNWELIEEDLQWLNEKNNHLITKADKNYPALLKEISIPPFLLFASGNIDILNKLSIAIVGSRNPTPTGLEIAEYFAQELANEDFVVISGMAIGIDGAAHHGALKAKGKTIAVLGSGLKKIYPARHRKLFEEIIINNGIVISEFPLDATPLRQNFPIRNRVISGLSLGTLIVEASLRSGSLITAKCALNQSREVFAIPGSIRNPLSQGPHHLIQQGAKLVTGIQDILEEINPFFLSLKRKITKDTAKEKLDLEHRKLLNCFGYESIAIDQLIERSSLTTEKAIAMLITLELEGYIQATAGGYIRSTSKDELGK